MTKYILSGDAKEVDKILRENRVRMERGLVRFTPTSIPLPDDAEVIVTDDKNVHGFDDKKPKGPKKKKTE